MDAVTPMPIVYAYIRWSSDEQGDGSSEERQRSQIAAFAEQHGRLVWIADPGVSARDGYNLAHGSIAKLRDDILAGRREAGMIAIAEPSRLSRAKLWTMLSFISPLMLAGCSIGVVSKNMILRDAEDRSLVDLFVFGVDQQGGHTENEKRVSMVRNETTIRRRKIAETPGTKYSARVPDWLTCPRVQRKGDHKRDITPIPDREALVAEIYDLAQSMGSTQIATRLNDLRDIHPRYKPWRGSRWTQDVISNLLSNEAVIGRWQPHRVDPRPGSVANPDSRHKRRPLIRIPVGDPIEGYYPAVISRDLWDRVQAAKSTRSAVKSGRPSRENVNVFAGLCRCGVCGSAMYLMGRNARGKNDYVRCPSKQSGGGCTNATHYSVSRLERAFLRHGIGILTTAADWSSPSDHLDGLVAKLDAAKDLVKAASRRFENARAAVAEGDTAEERAALRATMRDMQARLTEAETERDALERDLTVARGTDAEGSLRAADALIGSVEAGIPDARLQLSQIVKTIIETATFEGGRVYLQPRRLAPSGRQPRRLVVEFLEGSRGRRVVDDAEKVYIEGQDMTQYDFRARLETLKSS